MVLVLTHNLLDGDVNVDNNSVENLIRPWAVRRRAWSFAGSAHNQTCKPFAWTATADSILAKLHRLCSRISGTGR